MDNINAFITRVETEMSVGWASNNPALFLNSWQDFYRNYGNDEWTIRARTTKGSIILIAEKVTA